MYKDEQLKYIRTIVIVAPPSKDGVNRVATLSHLVVLLKSSLWEVHLGV